MTRIPMEPPPSDGRQPVRPGTFLVGWTGSNLHRGHRYWICTTCDAEIHANPGRSLLR